VPPAQNSLPLSSLLADAPGDDNSGQVAVQGFGYQEWYSVLRVTELLDNSNNGNDFAVCLEVKEDVAVLDSSTNPTKVEFCQVKTNEQAVAWTLKELHRKGRKLKDGTYPPSILGKLYKRRHEFMGNQTTLRFVSNTSFKVSSGNVNVNAHDFHLPALSEQSKQELCKSLASQLAVAEADIDLNQFHLHRSNLPLADQHLIISGKLSELSSNGSLPFKVPQPGIAAVMLASEVRAKASNTNFCTTFEELKSARVISRTDVLRTLAVLSDPPKSLEDTFAEAVERLNSEKYNFLGVQDIKRQLSRLLTSVADRTNILFRNQVLAITHSIEEVKSLDRGATTQLSTFLDAVVEKARNKYPSDFVTVDEPFLLALSLMVIHNGININVLTATAGSEPEVTK